MAKTVRVFRIEIDLDSYVKDMPDGSEAKVEPLERNIGQTLIAMGQDMIQRNGIVEAFEVRDPDAGEEDVVRCTLQQVEWPD